MKKIPAREKLENIKQEITEVNEKLQAAENEKKNLINDKEKWEKIKLEAQAAKDKAINDIYEWISELNQAENDNTYFQKANDPLGMHKNLFSGKNLPDQPCIINNIVINNPIINNIVTQQNINLRSTPGWKFHYQSTEERDAKLTANEFINIVKMQAMKIKIADDEINKLIEKEGTIDFSSISENLKNLQAEQRILVVETAVDDEEEVIKLIFQSDETIDNKETENFEDSSKTSISTKTTYTETFSDYTYSM
ncbi:hypothetical protein I862_00140 [endosymbiont of Acanthamoeba sp. UWC8]|uniref:hypothetical protein n=1 Tax=endosymbiont of Acanthamoeba sp. UWC8 TaxID=86106 RepID=UPI0004D0B7ED|nr:hypothetical protein [endosymbiont of Acanthamoeba sp. UWC8]AIF80593.1 hypothetical protein I862_00140 [endosymbiont of Acanthamoeba sp. UWC8]